MRLVSAPSPSLVVVALLEHGERDGDPTYLVAHRPDHAYLGGTWELPGGRVEPGEPPEEALVRELADELGVTTEVVRPLTFSWYRYPDRTVLILFYLTRTLPGSTPQPLASSELRLLDRAALTALEMPPANQPLKDLLLRTRQDPLL